MPTEVERLAKKYMRAFCYISIGEPGGGKKEIEQRVEFMSEGYKK
jgi:ATP-dependent RNA helicase DDX23/PRP28